MILAGSLSFDLTVAHAVQSYQPTWLTFVAKMITLGSQPEIIVPVVIIISIWLYLRKKSMQDLALLLFMAGNALTLMIKALVQRPRPAASLVHVLAHETSTGFPSGHALAAVLTAGAAWFILRRYHSPWLGLVLVFYVLAVGWSRVYLGVHWVSDVLAGYIFGLGWLLLSWGILRRVIPRTL